jgi:MFS family permease
MEEKEVLEKDLKKDESVLKEKTLKLSVVEGSSTSVMSGAGEAYVVPFALSLNASNVQIGFLSSFVALFGAIFQVFGSQMIYTRSRKKIISLFVFLQASLWLAILGLGILAIYGYVSIYAPVLLIFLYVIYSIFGNLSSPSWFSMMGDLVDERKRGKYFSRRNSIAGAVAMFVTFFAAVLLDYTKEVGFLLWGFVILFGVAAMGRFFAAYLFTKHYEPESKAKKESYFSFFRFIKKAPSNNFGRFVIYIALISMANAFAAPSFAVYMLNDLSYSYITFTLVNLSGSLFTILSIPYWGRISDIRGNKFILTIGAIMIVFSPILWVFFKSPVYLIFTAQLVSGLGWAAFNLGASNFIYDAVTPQRRAICVAYYALITNFGVFIGAMIGGLFAQHVVIKGFNIFLIIFFISGVGRAVVSLIFLPRFKEVRNLPSDKENILISNRSFFFHPKPLFDLFRGVKGVSETIEMKKDSVEKEK